MILSTHSVRRQDATTRPRALTVLLVAATVATGLMAGFFYAYACSVMVGLARTDDRTFISSMQWINATVRNAAFAPAFFGALLLTAAAAVLALRHRRPSAGWVMVATVLYGAAFLITMLFNVPLNEQLAAAGPPNQIPEPAAVRAGFEGPWVRWNLLRTGFSIAALGAMSVALLRDGRTTGGSATPRP